MMRNESESETTPSALDGELLVSTGVQKELEMEAIDMKSHSKRF